ncbi:MAG: sigma factor [Herbinix sp.]|nr:sigma factor [Herbinix sp.]
MDFTIELNFALYFEYRKLIDNELKRYIGKSNYEELYDAGIAGLFKAIDSMEENYIDFKTFALFHIKSSINNILNYKD